MKPEITGIPTEGPRAIFGAWAFLAVLAYPDDRHKRAAFCKACHAAYAKGLAKVRPERRADIPPDHFHLPNQQIDGTVRRAIRVIQYHRLPAAQMLRERIRWHFPGYGPMLALIAGRPGLRVRKPTVAELLIRAERFRMEHRTGRRIEHFSEKKAVDHGRERTWNPTSPVFHLALALLLEIEIRKISRLSWFALNSDWLVPAMTRAAWWAPVIRAREFARGDACCIHLISSGADWPAR